jgi:hypothetical protein
MKKIRIAAATAAFALAFAGVFATGASNVATIHALYLNTSSVCIEDTVDDVCTLTTGTNRCKTITANQDAYKFNAQTACSTAIFRP